MSGGERVARSQRFPIKIPLRYRIFGKGEWLRGRTVDISSSGVFFRCHLSAERGTRVEVNFVLLNSPVKQSGLEVACTGEVVRLEPPPSTEYQAALAVKISDYRLLPFVPGRSNLDYSFGQPEVEE
jgi:hypothetical protein